LFLACSYCAIAYVGRRFEGENFQGTEHSFKL
jgi:hypothetical protein